MTMEREGVAVFGSSQTEPGSTEWEDARRAGASWPGPVTR
jgi:hypothetical protein